MQSTGTAAAGQRKDRKGRGDGATSNSVQVYQGTGVGTSTAVKDSTKPKTLGDPTSDSPDVIAMENEINRFVPRGPGSEPVKGVTRRPTAGSRHYNSNDGGTDRQNYLSHTSAELDGASNTEDNLNPEIIAIERRMEHMSQSLAPPTKPFGTPTKPKPPTRPKPQSSSTQPQTDQTHTGTDASGVSWTDAPGAPWTDASGASQTDTSGAPRTDAPSHGGRDIVTRPATRSKK